MHWGLGDEVNNFFIQNYLKMTTIAYIWIAKIYHMSKFYSLTKYTFLGLLFFTSATLIYAQKPAAKPAAAKPGGAASKTKATVKATLAADMDCLVIINGVAKAVSVKAYTPTPATLNAGDNTIEATSSDKKSTYNTSVNAKVGETPIVEISFFDDRKFLDYIKQGSVSMVETAIKKDPGLVNNENQSLTTPPLVTAIENSQVEIVKLLLDKGASFTLPENIFPLHKSALYASSAQKGKDKIAPDKALVDLFLSKGCKITDKDDGGNTPLHCAVRGGKLELVKFLIENGADVNAKNDFDDMPLKIAEDKGYVSIIDVLKAKGALDK